MPSSLVNPSSSSFADNTLDRQLKIEDVVSAILDLERTYGFDAKEVLTNITDVRYDNSSTRRIVFVTR